MSRIGIITTEWEARVASLEADLTTLRDTAGRYRAALVSSRDLFELLRGHVDVRLVPELDKLIASARAALATTPGSATTEPQSEKLRWRAEKISAADSRERPALPCEPCRGTGACPGGCGRAIPHTCDACMGDGRAPATPGGEGTP